MEGEGREGRSLRHSLLGGGGRPEISPPRSFLKVGAYGNNSDRNSIAMQASNFKQMPCQPHLTMTVCRNISLLSHH